MPKNRTPVLDTPAARAANTPRTFVFKDAPGKPQVHEVTEPFCTVADLHLRLHHLETRYRRRRAGRHVAEKPPKPNATAASKELRDACKRVSDLHATYVRAVEERDRLKPQDAAATRTEHVERAAEAALAGDFSLADQPAPSTEGEYDRLSRRATALYRALHLAYGEAQKIRERVILDATRAARPRYADALQKIADAVGGLDSLIAAAAEIPAELRRAGEFTDRGLRTVAVDGHGQLGPAVQRFLAEVKAAHGIVPKKGR